MRARVHSLWCLCILSGLRGTQFIADFWEKYGYRRKDAGAFLSTECRNQELFVAGCAGECRFCVRCVWTRMYQDSAANPGNLLLSMLFPEPRARGGMAASGAKN